MNGIYLYYVIYKTGVYVYVRSIQMCGTFINITIKHVLMDWPPNLMKHLTNYESNRQLKKTTLQKYFCLRFLRHKNKKY